jgi:hypothetical protein
LNPDPKARVLLALKRHAEAFGEVTTSGVRVHVSALDLAREVGCDETAVEAVLGRLRRLRIAAEDATGTIVIADIGRLLEFLEFLEMPRKFEAN